MSHEQRRQAQLAIETATEFTSPGQRFIDRVIQESVAERGLQIGDRREMDRNTQLITDVVKCFPRIYDQPTDPSTVPTFDHLTPSQFRWVQHATYWLNRPMQRSYPYYHIGSYEQEKKTKLLLVNPNMHESQTRLLTLDVPKKAFRGKQAATAERLAVAPSVAEINAHTDRNTDKFTVSHASAGNKHIKIMDGGGMIASIGHYLNPGIVGKQRTWHHRGITGEQMELFGVYDHLCELSVGFGREHQYRYLLERPEPQRQLPS